MVQILNMFDIAAKLEWDCAPNTNPKSFFEFKGCFGLQQISDNSFPSISQMEPMEVHSANVAQLGDLILI